MGEYRWAIDGFKRLTRGVDGGDFGNSEFGGGASGFGRAVSAVHDCLSRVGLANCYVGLAERQQMRRFRVLTSRQGLHGLLNPTEEDDDGLGLFGLRPKRTPLERVQMLLKTEQ